MSRFARAMHEAIAYTNSHLPDTVDMVASYTHLEPAIIARSVRTRDAEYIDANLFKPLIDLAYRYKLIDRLVPAEDLFSSVVVRAPK